MSDTAIPRAEPKTKAEYRAEIDRMFAEMKRLDESITRRQANIDRLASETRAQLEALKRQMGL